MAGSVNKAMLIGDLGKDPDVRRMSSGQPLGRPSKWATAT